jgi:hypothetical protein
MRLILDMDGVLCHFYKHAIEAHGKNYNQMMESWPRGVYVMDGVMGLSESDFYAPLSNVEFWATMPWTHDGKQILMLAEESSDEIYLWTRPSFNSDSGKRAWVHNHIPRYDDKLIIGGSKEVAASSNTLLIDDMDLNIQKFRAAGGNGILVPRIWNSRHELASASLGIIWGEIDEYCGTSA